MYCHFFDNVYEEIESLTIMIFKDEEKKSFGFIEQENTNSFSIFCISMMCLFCCMKIESSYSLNKIFISTFCIADFSINLEV